VLEEITDPEPGPGQILVRVAGCGACHSDLYARSGGMAERPRPAPWTLGHESAGWVHALGPGVYGVEEGEPVAVFGGWGCGQCQVCLAGEEQLCAVSRWCGIGADGGFAEYMLVPAARHLVRLGNLDPVAAAPLTDAGLTSYRAVKKVLPRLVPGSAVLVIGVGGLGHYGIQHLKSLSSALVIAIDPAEPKRALASELGADLVINPDIGDAASEIASFTGSRGAAAVLDFVGTQSTLNTALATVARKGAVVLVGLARGTVPYSFFSMAAEAELMTSYWGTREELGEVIVLAGRGRLQGRLERHSLDDINVVFERLERGDVDGRAVLIP
jgi:propanol-preferring alcohol dehydrogenase